MIKQGLTVKDVIKELQKHDDKLFVVFNNDKQNRYFEDRFIQSVVKKRNSKCLSLRPFLKIKKENKKR